MKDARAYIEHMLTCIQKVEDFVSGDKQAFLNSVLIQDAVLRNLQVMVESSPELPFLFTIIYCRRNDNNLCF